MANVSSRPSGRRKQRRLTSSPSDNGDDPFAPDTTWTPVDLGPIARGERTAEPPTIGRRDDGVHLIYPGKVHAINSESEAGKSWVALAFCAQEMALGRHVLYLDFEDSAEEIFERLLNLGEDKRTLLRHFHYIRPDESLTDAAADQFNRAANRWDHCLAIIDGVTEAFELHDLNILSNNDAARFNRILTRPLARAGIAVLALDHVTKDPRGRGRGGIGAQHKLSGVDGATYSLEIKEQFSRGCSGWGLLKIHKDRPGWVRPHGVGPTNNRTIARINFVAADQDDSLGESDLRVTFGVPSGVSVGTKVKVSAGVDEASAKAREAVVQALRSRDGGFRSGRAVHAAVRKINDDVNLTLCQTILSDLVGEGLVELGRTGPKRAQPHRWIGE